MDGDEVVFLKLRNEGVRLIICYFGQLIYFNKGFVGFFSLFFLE